MRRVTRRTEGYVTSIVGLISLKDIGCRGVALSFASQSDRDFCKGKKKPTCSDAVVGRSSTSGYCLIDPPGRPGCPSSSHPTILKS